MDRISGHVTLTDAGAWFWATAAVMVIAFLVTTFLWIFDRRRIGRESVWAKPLKFELSLSVHFVTLGLLSERLSWNVRASEFLMITAVAAALASGFEIIYIVFRASRQEASHFNVETPVAKVMYPLMAVGALVITAAAAIVGALVSADTHFNGGPGLRWGSCIGLMVGALLTIITAFTMGGTSRHVGEEADDAPRMPLTGWSLTVGDRRPAHFGATHMMQALPLVGLLYDQWLPPAAALPALTLISIAYAWSTLLLYRKAGRGEPVFNLKTDS